MNESKSVFDRVLANPRLYDALDDDTRIHVLSTLREVYLDIIQRAQATPEYLVSQVQSVLDVVAPSHLCDVAGMAFTPYPSAAYCSVRFLDQAALPKAQWSHFERLDALPSHLIVFVDPRAFHYRNYECIVSLDDYFEGCEMMAAPTNWCARDVEQLYTFDLAPEPSLKHALDRLDDLGLYVPPLNAATRGGDRYIFHCAALADLLTKAVLSLMPESMADGFVHVNPVFRCNRFLSTDAPFASHLDTPYCDSKLKHVSKYTLLLYLTEGAAEDGVLCVGEQVLTQVGQMQCVLIHQSLEHEGHAFDVGNKVFLRTECIYEVEQLVHEPRLGELFTRACYFTGESMFNSALAEYASECYDRAAKARWDGDLPERQGNVPFMRKQVKHVEMNANYGVMCSLVTNGCDYWFPKHEHTQFPHASCAMLALLDYFNGEIWDLTFRTSSKSVVVEGPLQGQWVDAYLKTVEPFEETPELFQRPISTTLYPDAEKSDDTQCCPRCRPDDFMPTRSSSVIHYYDQYQAYTREHLPRWPVKIMGDTMYLSPEQFLLLDGRVHIMTPDACAPFHFAAYNCWEFTGLEPDDYINPDVRIELPHLLVPPVVFRELEHSYHVQMYFFRNDWMIDHRETLRLPVPKIAADDHGSRWRDDALSYLKYTGDDPQRWW